MEKSKKHQHIYINNGSNGNYLICNKCQHKRVIICHECNRGVCCNGIDFRLIPDYNKDTKCLITCNKCEESRKQEVKIYKMRIDGLLKEIKHRKELEDFDRDELLGYIKKQITL